MTVPTTTTAADPHTRAMARLLTHAATAEHRYRTKACYRLSIPSRDRAWFERAWATLRRGGWLIPDPNTRKGTPERYVRGHR
jgi:hypothetical protein